ncbi:hypothetical protein OEZ85_012748 [Tetradesmus obliquus]|uniref:Uncharacterized protein n=1 Tax=Tetradesmus obliquus TaxID=3088 RepID=A0ABY8U3U5_TETOB|nr:hypothetical protein OEZ85_012748 [Tetradesmus obliquus]
MFSGSYWPKVKSSKICRGRGKFWAYNVCWKHNQNCAAAAQDKADIILGKDEFSRSAATHLHVRKEPQEGNFCSEEAMDADMNSLGFGFHLGSDGAATGWSQSGFSFAPSTTASGPSPTAGAGVTIGGVEIAGGSGVFVASGFEGEDFEADQSVTTEVTADAGAPQTVTFKGGPYTMKFSKDFDTANFIRFEGDGSGAPDTSTFVLCMFGNYTAVKLCGSSQAPC